MFNTEIPLPHAPAATVPALRKLELGYALGRYYGFSCVDALEKESARAHRNYQKATRVAARLEITLPAEPIDDNSIEQMRNTDVFLRLKKAVGSDAADGYGLGICMTDIGLGTALHANIKDKLVLIEQLCTVLGVPETVWKEPIATLKRAPTVANAIALDAVIDRYFRFPN